MLLEVVVGKTTYLKHGWPFNEVHRVEQPVRNLDERETSQTPTRIWKEVKATDLGVGRRSSRVALGAGLERKRTKTLRSRVWPPGKVIFLRKVFVNKWLDSPQIK